MVHVGSPNCSCIASNTCNYMRIYIHMCVYVCVCVYVRMRVVKTAHVSHQTPVITCTYIYIYICVLSLYTCMAAIVQVHILLVYNSIIHMPTYTHTHIHTCAYIYISNIPLCNYVYVMPLCVLCTSTVVRGIRYVV